MSRRTLGCAASILAVVLVTGCDRHVDNSRHVPAVRALVATTPRWVDRSALGTRLWAVERDFYMRRGFQPAWIDGNRPTPQMTDLLSQLKYSEVHGLDPTRYHVAEFEQIAAGAATRTSGTRFDVAIVPELDARMTYAYLRYAADLLGWNLDPRRISKNWLASPKKDDLAARLATAVAAGKVRDSLEALAPTHPQYKGLQAALMREREHPTGRLQQIEMNLERWRWLPRDLGDRYILVNVPAYQMQVMEGDRPTLAMRVIVGAPDNQTPLFSDTMTYVVFSPYWNIPEEILKKETLPRLASDPDYLERNHIEVVGTSGKDDVLDAKGIDWSDEKAIAGLRFRQEPGPENALGLVKFIFPNHFNVYLHDTPTDRLFFKPTRALSHGCIRVEKPVALAEYVMQDRPEWTAERITTAMHAETEQTVNLKRPLPVHIGYWTAWVEPDGKTVTYTGDPYGLDAIQARVSDEGRTR
jgi:murein L,D-transpeptidase YcbB/YkuD